jgi:hypothetical protein
VRRLGAKDQLVEWFKPKDAPDWMSAEQYAVLPASLLLLSSGAGTAFGAQIKSLESKPQCSFPAGNRDV